MSILRKGRFASSMNEEAMRFTSSMGWDRWLFEQDINVDRAHVVMLHKMRHISKKEAASILAGLEVLEGQGFDQLPEGEDVHESIESALTAQIGEVGGKMHTARSRNDEVATCLRMAVRDELLSMLHTLAALRSLLLSIAGKHTLTLMPGFTHLQHAQPTTLAHYMLAHEQALSRDSDRVLDCLRRVNLCPLGSAAFASTSFKIDRALTSELLGFDAPLENTMDAVSSRDFAIEALCCASMLMLDTSRLFEELVLWSTLEFAFVQLPDAYTSTSSIMPQKKNPDVAEVGRAKSGTVVGQLVAFIMITKALAQSYNRDLQEGTPHLLGGLKETHSTLKMCSEMVEHCVFDTERMRKTAPLSFACATELANTLTRECNIPFRHAHSIVGGLARENLYEPRLKDIDRIATELLGYPLSEKGLEEQDIEGALELMSCVERYANLGGPSPKSTKESIRRAKRRMSAHRRALAKREKSIRAARTALEQECKSIMGAV
ncbi:MAG: argininosuccinate lyase [Methermicoccaceae archaeon]